MKLYFRKYQQRRTTTSTVSPVITRRYPTKYYVGKLADQEEDREDLYSKYTTASTFRNKNRDKTDTPASPKEMESDKKYFNADAIEIKVPSLGPGGKANSFTEKGNHKMFVTLYLLHCIAVGTMQ